MSTHPTFSLIVPTRERPKQLRAFLSSVAATAHRPTDVEVVLVIDADDPDSASVACDRVQLQRVIVPPGLTMGALNSAGYENSTGAYVMLLNDDVICRTPGWDGKIKAVSATCPDEILLVHVNDTLMRTALCTFPIVSRTFCELIGGICPAEYVRYRIDDHVEDYFNLLHVLGETRTVYLPGVVFEHGNCEERVKGLRQYFSDERILALDAPTFERLLPRRKELALHLMEQLHPREAATCIEKWRARLDAVNDSLSIRSPERQRMVSHFSTKSLSALRERISKRLPEPRKRAWWTATIARRLRSRLNRLRRRI